MLGDQVIPGKEIVDKLLNNNIWLFHSGTPNLKKIVFGKIKFPKTAKFLSSIPFPNLPINVRVF